MAYAYTVYAKASEEPNVTLTLKPKMCVLSRLGEDCQDELNINWQASSAINVCLYQAQSSMPLACWENAQEGYHHTLLSTANSLAFLLRSSKKHKPLASETFEVLHDHKQFRRARRNAWAFF